MGMLTGGVSRPTINCDPKKGAKQSFKDECDINKIIKKYQASGQISHISRHQGVYADVSETNDYRTAIEQVRAADKVFMGLSPATRAKLHNSPAALLDLLADPSRRGELVDLGLEELVESVDLIPVLEPVEPAPEPPSEA